MSDEMKGIEWETRIKLAKYSYLQTLITKMSSLNEVIDRLDTSQRATVICEWFHWFVDLYDEKWHELHILPYQKR